MWVHPDSGFLFQDTLMNIWKHFKEQPFIVLVAFAALPHTVWTIGTYTAGIQPDAFGDWANLIRAVAWLLPPLMFGIAFDIGQVVTAGEIRNGNRSRWLVRTFYALSVFSYISQLLYAMHHYPKLDIGTGAVPLVTSIGSFISQCAVFVLPALLPAAQVLYTMAYHQQAPLHTIEIKPVSQTEKFDEFPETSFLSIPHPVKQSTNGSHE
jgi:hypothetical protein